jgi:hypothetical protein
MGHSQDKSSSRAAPHGRSKKRKRDNTSSNRPFGEAQGTTPQKIGGNTSKKQKRHKSHHAREPATTVAINEEENPKPVEDKLKTPTAENLKRNKTVGDDRRGPEKSEKDGERPKRFIVFIGRFELPDLLLSYQANSFREPTVHGNNRLYKQAFCVAQTRINSTYHPQRPAHKVQGICIPRIRRLRPHENMSEATSPIHI